MIKSDLIAIVAQKARTTNIMSENVVNAVFEVMKDALLRGERIELRGFGSFAVKQYESYTGRNPKTGSEIRVSPKRLPVFKVGKHLAERINRR